MTEFDPASKESVLIVYGWNKYYSEPASSFRESDSSYRDSLSYLSHFNPFLLDPDLPKTFMIGGFHPFNGTPMEFMYFCRTIHSNANDQHIFVDANPEAINAAPKGPTIKSVQSSLEKLPFDMSSIDFMFLDYTPYFMSDEEISLFANKASEILTDNGVALIAKRYNYFEISNTQSADNNYSIPRFPRKLEDLLSLMLPLKPVGFTRKDSNSDHATYIVFAKKDSIYPEAIPNDMVLREGAIVW